MSNPVLRFLMLRFYKIPKPARLTVTLAPLSGVRAPGKQSSGLFPARTGRQAPECWPALVAGLRGASPGDLGDPRHSVTPVPPGSPPSPSSNPVTHRGAHPPSRPRHRRGAAGVLDGSPAVCYTAVGDGEGVTFRSPLRRRQAPGSRPREVRQGSAAGRGGSSRQCQRVRNAPLSRLRRQLP